MKVGDFESAVVVSTALQMYEQGYISHSAYTVISVMAIKCNTIEKNAGFVPCHPQLELIQQLTINVLTLTRKSYK